MGKMLSLDGKTALITGSGRGIGKAIALRFAEAGAKVVVNSLSPAGEEVAAHICSNGGQAVFVQADVSQSNGVDALFKAAQEAFGGVDILVNNAGITRDQLTMRLSEEDWDSVIQTNLKSVFLCSKAALRQMLKNRWGRIINLSSIVGLKGNPGQANYAAAKAGILGFSCSLAKEVASRNITVNSIAPGFIETDMTAALSKEQRQAIAERIPMQKLGTVEDVAACALYLAKEDAKYITGQVISLDGGMSII
ncbi:3-oxoacyl-[acyl-carrier-protein] reductase [Dehalococcoides mccartyi]|uniref:3-oxoacyl-[acyl-carrier-protein] reductase n=1 Tax=Dehalococcoides mccartyi TaxID=61435 RepID=UPI00059CEA3D|nr:3-oxoacyl-[acyl-carrier-protein] reductase [Dehalococcoides mccartyi]